MTRAQKTLTIVGGFFLALFVAWFLRSDPIMMISGKQLSGEEFPYPATWDFTSSQNTIAIETRPDDPHSVTTLAFIHEGRLHIPAQSGSDKTWTQYVLDDPRVRIKAGGKIFPAQAERVLPFDILDYRDSIGQKYPRMAARPPEQLPPDVWLFRIVPRSD